MSFLFRGNIARSPATYLFKGLFPNLSRYLSVGPRCTTKKPSRASSPTVSTKAQGVAIPDNGPAEEQGHPKEGITETIIEEGLPAEQLCTPRFISPHPLACFADVPTVCGIQSNHVVAGYVFDPKRPLFLLEDVTPSFKSSGVEAEPSSTKENLDTPAQAVSMSEKSPNDEAWPSSAEGSFDTPARPLHPEMSAGFDLESRKRLNRHSLPTFPLTHSRDVSTSSNDTLVWSPSDQSSALSLVTSHFGRELQDAAEKIIGEKQAENVHGLEEAIAELRLKLADQTRRAEGLETDLEICDRDRELNFNTALRLYQNQGNLVFLERRNLIDQVEQLKFEVLDRDSQIWSRDQLIEALRLDLTMYASQEHWVFVRQCFYALQQQYGQMPQDFRILEQKYEGLEDTHIDLSNRFRKLEGDHTELKVQLDQIKDERNRLEDDAEEAASRYEALEVERDRIKEQKSESERRARANEQFLAELSARMFKRIVFMADVLDEMDVNPMDNEQIALCRLAYEHLGLDATEISNNFETAGANGGRVIEEERDESDVPETHAGEGSSSMSTSESNNHEPAITIARNNDSSMVAATDGDDDPESPNTFDARRRREIAVAEETILGPLGLGFEDGSPTLKAKQIPESSKSSKVSKFMALFPKTPDIPGKPWGGPLMSGTDDIDQVTPARTGGTGGIARDQWEIAGDDLQEYTEVFRGPRTQPIDLVSPDLGTEGADHDNRLEVEKPSQYSDGPILNMDEHSVHENDLVEEMGAGSDFDVGEDGGSNGGVPVIGSGTETLAHPEPTSQPALTGVFNLSSAFLAQDPRDACDSPRFEQDFNFGGSNGRVSFTTSETTSSLPAPAPEVEPTGASSAPGTSLAEHIASVIARADEEAPKEEISDEDAVEKEGTDPNMPNKEKAKEEPRKKKEEARKTQPKFEGPNRSQRRAASRERKAAEKKAQAAARNTAQGGRHTVTRAMMRG